MEDLKEGLNNLIKKTLKMENFITLEMTDPRLQTQRTESESKIQEVQEIHQF